MDSAGANARYVVPCYRAREGEAWFHFLHGNVPGHEIDFMYRPEVPQGALSRQHYSHLDRLMQYIEPHAGAGYAFSIGNLSRDDTQHEPGHGGVALVFGLRIRGATDHAGRPDPPFSHGVAVIDRALTAPVLRRAAAAFHRRVIGDAASAEWYRSYVRSASEAPGELERILAGYVAGFDDLPTLEPSAMSLAWTTGGAARAGRVVFVYPDDAPFEVLAGAASRIAAVLYRSDVRWSAISSGREADVPGGLTVRFVPESAVGAADHGASLHAISEIPEDEEAIARELFGATPVARAGEAGGGWRDRYEAAGDGVAGGEGQASAPAAPAQEVEITVDETTLQMEVAPPVKAPPTAPSPVEPPPRSEPAPALASSRKRGAAVAACFVAGLAAMLYGVFVRDTDTPPPAAPVAQEPAPVVLQKDEKITAEPTGVTPAPAPVVGAPSAPGGGLKWHTKPTSPGKGKPGVGCSRILNGPPCW